MPQIDNRRKHLMMATALGGALVTLISVAPATADDNGQGEPQTATPIKHVIVLIGENRSFDNVYGMYRPGNGQSIGNLLSRGIVNAAGDALLNTKAQQFSINLPLSSATYFIDSRATPGKTPYSALPLPNVAYAPQVPTTPADWVNPTNQIAQAPFD